MKHFYLFLFFTGFTMTCYSQISYEAGYFINNNGQKNEVLIRNEDWLHNPVKFKYRLAENGETGTATINEVREFGIYNYSRFIRSTVDIDRSSSNLRDLSPVRDPEFKEEQLFLEVLVDGKADLYKYQDSEVTRYFFALDGSDIEQLIYKQFRQEQNAAKNTAFRKQLWDNVRCGSITATDLQKVDYSKRELVRYFVTYNECENEEVTNFQDYKKKDLLNITFRAGVDRTSLMLDYLHGTRYTSPFYDGTDMGYRVGIEAEIILPFHRNKWSVLVEPTYKYLQITGERFEQQYTVDYQFFELPIGLRHYFFLNENSAMFLNAAYVLEFPSNSFLDLQHGDIDAELMGESHVTAGLGFKYNRKYSIEVRYGLPRDIMDNNKIWTSEFSNVSFVLGYTFL